MSATDSACPPKSSKGEKSARRLARALEIFPHLPDDGLVEIMVVSALIGRSPASIWRDVEQGRLEPPLKVGPNSTRFRAGGVRAVMKGARNAS